MEKQNNKLHLLEYKMISPPAKFNFQENVFTESV